MSTQRRWSGPALGRLAVMGAGQIGGSVALAARAAGAVSEVVAWSRTREKLERAKSLGIIDRSAGSAAEAAQGAALVVLATPVRSLGEIAAEIAGALAPGAIVIDVGSVKATAIAAVEPKLPAGAFVACHPIAGTERVGPDAASPLLFEGKRCVLCPTALSRPEAVATVERLWTAMGAEPVRMDADLHDRVLGAGSHLPHVAAYALAGTLGAVSGDVVEGLRRLPTPSLRDTTRVAASSPVMWRDIFLDNRAEVLPLVEAYLRQVEALRAAIAAGDGKRIEQLLDAGKSGRDRLVPG
ncbi:MAG TPA: prephenate dehydrogenase/arogenate dehydrogenase family protein [Polyangia bacterium]|nr:prephenate dehydrogenase/arogenate dehydrogenase family protein [Polyangia bacterium]